MGVRNIARIAVDKETDWLTAGWVGPDAGAPSPTWGPAKYETATIITQAGNHGWPYCMGNKQPYRDRSTPDAERADRLVRLRPPEERVAPQHRSGRPPAGPRQHDLVLAAGRRPGLPEARPTAAACRPTSRRTTTYTQPWLKGGGQAIMDGPTYHRAQVDTNSGVAWPAYWDDKWFIGDESNGNNRVAVTVDPDDRRTARRRPPSPRTCAGSSARAATATPSSSPGWTPSSARTARSTCSTTAAASSPCTPTRS